MCGEQAVFADAERAWTGSPPRVRGTEKYRNQLTRQQGITPACAGNRRREPYGAGPGQDHPRVCGEQAVWLVNSCGLMGSPPRVRGTEKCACCRRNLNRITPACAGNSGFREAAKTILEDHPRVCGEQRGGGDGQCAPVGSPPRVRGTGDKKTNGELDGGITPACAGNRQSHDAAVGGCEDHPRVCGEQFVPLYDEENGSGSPPRVRGTAQMDRISCLYSRITPACAGNRF